MSEDENRKSFRMDFVTELVEVNDEDGTFKMLAIPDPERYEERTIDGEEGYWDTFEEFFIPKEEMQRAAKRSADDLPFYYTPRKIDNINDHIDSRREDIRNTMSSGLPEHEFEDASEQKLEELAEENDTRFIILVIDIEGSTELSQRLDSDENTKIIQLFQQEMSILVDVFQGYVLKYGGDGLIAYFPDPDYIGMHDNAIDCATSMIKTVQQGINPVLEESDLPSLDVRIGMDSGEADIVSMGAEGVKRHRDLIGRTINVAAKIEGRADTNTIYLGEETERNLHTMWRKNTEEVDVDWDYEDVDGSDYRLYKFPAT
ncbi:MAG: adenylate cyclase [Candidatus Nanohaloarchaea archaeon]|jgi:adenylate cyclase